MKKISSLLLLLLAVCIALAAFTACEPDETPSETYTVTFKNGDEVVDTKTVNAGECVTELPKLTVESDKQFDGWYVGDTPFTTAMPVTSNLTVFAKISDKLDETKYTVTFKLDADTIFDAIKCNPNDKIDLYDYAPMEYEVHSWVDSDGNKYDYDEIYTITKDVTLTAVNAKRVQFMLQLSNDKTHYIIVGLLDTSSTAITVPDEYFGLPVKEIAANAFAGYNNTLKTLTVTDTIEKIGEGAFAGLYGLNELSVPFVGEQKYDEVSGNGLRASFVYWFADNVSITYRPDYVRGYSLYYDGNGEEIEENIALAERYLPKSLTKVTVNGGAIANYAFHTVSTIETICLGDEVTALGDHAFSINPQNSEMPSTDYMLKYVECSENSKITSIGEYCFGNQLNLEKVCVAPKVKVIHDSLFRGFEKLTEVKIFENSELEEIKDNAFYGAPITSIYLPDTLTTIGVHAFASCNLIQVNIPQSTVNLEAGIFRSCESLTSVTFAPQAQITAVPSLMFAGCTNLATVKLPASIVKFEEQAFNNCKSLSNLDDDEVGFELQNVTYIGDSALAATSFRYIDISEDITYIGGGAFAGCSKLEGIYFNDESEDCKLTEIRDYTFDDCRNLKSITLPDSITKIGIRAFSYTGLKTVNLPANLEVIDDRAFYLFNSEESALTTITDLGDLEYLKSIGDSAFENNSKLNFTSLPESLKTVGSMAFRNTGISGTITIDPATLTEIGAYAFANCSKATIRVVGTNSDIPSKWQDGWAGSGKTATRVTFTDENEHYIMSDGRFEYYYEEDGVYYITKYVGDESEVVLQDTFNDLPVVYNQSVFASNEELTSLTLAPNMTEIPRGFCTDCTNLTTVIVPETAKITSIGDYAFRHCHLYSFTIPDASELTYVGAYAFYGNYEATHITLTNNSNIAYIGDYAFKTWFSATGTKLINLDLDLSKTKYIGDYAFANNVSVIAAYTLTSSLEYLGEAAFSGNKKLTITLSDDFETTRFENNVFDQVKTLIWENVDFTGVEYIGDSAFSSTGGAFANAKITIPSSVTYIGQSAFHSAKLVGATIDCNSELEIGNNAFGSNTKGFYLVIKGTPKKIGNAICSSILNAHIYFTEAMTLETETTSWGSVRVTAYKLGDSDCEIALDFNENDDEHEYFRVPYFGAGQWTADENGEPIHPNDGHQESVKDRS